GPKRAPAVGEGRRAVATDPSDADGGGVRIAPWLSVRRGAAAVGFYAPSLGAVQLHRFENEDGEIVARLTIGEADFWVADDDAHSPETLGGGSARMIVTADDPDAAADRAIAA